MHFESLVNPNLHRHLKFCDLDLFWSAILMRTLIFQERDLFFFGFDPFFLFFGYLGHFENVIFLVLDSKSTTGSNPYACSA